MDTSTRSSWTVSHDNLTNYNETYTDSNMTEKFVPYSDRPETYIVPVLFAIIFVVGVLGNGTLIVIFMRHRNMRNVPNTYIFSLAIGDLLVILTCVPFTSTVYTLESWPYGEFICKLSEFVKDLSIGVSVFTLTALSADRFFAIVDPMGKHTGRRATKLTVFTACAIWVLAVTCAIPALIGSYLRKFEAPTIVFQVCYPYPEEFGELYQKCAILAKFIIYYFIPLTVIACFYILMARHLLMSTRNMPGEILNNQGQTKQVQARKKVAKTVLAFVIVFALCFFPHHVFMLWFYFYPDAQNNYNSFWHGFRITGFCLSFINSCINPIALYCISGTFRKHFNTHLFCCCCEEGVSSGQSVRSTQVRASARGGSSRQVTRERPTTKTTWGSCHSLVHFNSTQRRHQPEEHLVVSSTMVPPSTRTNDDDDDLSLHLHLHTTSSTNGAPLLLQEKNF